MQKLSWMFWLCVALVAAETVYGVYWGLPNIGIRLGIWPWDFHPGLRELIPTLSLGQEIAFFTHVVLNIVALAALLKRSALCLPAFLIAFILDRLDWIVLGLNPLSTVRNDTDGDFTAFISAFGGIGLMAILQLLTITLMAFMLQSGQIRFRGKTNPDWPFSSS